MKDLGYATGMTGKWHLGYKPEFHPQKRGFDDFFGFLGGAHSYVDANADRANLILRGTQPVDEKEYLTDAFAREAVAFIDRNHTRPFFLYLPFNAVHAPLQSLEKYLARFSSIQDERRRTFAAMQSAMDDAVGRVLKTLRESKLEENTLIFFISDNGGPTPNTTSGNGPLRGYKAQVLEGGIRIPFMMQWKGRIPAGKVYNEPVIGLDIHPTAVAAAGGSIPASAKLDGVNLLPFITGSSKGRPHDRLFWRFGPQAAVRMGDWKLLRMAGGEWELYNLAQDIGEKNNRAATDPAKAKELEAAFNEWNAQLMEPKWGPAQRRAAKAKAKAGGKGRKKQK
jgi:arylsulfatase A-like enzyme